MTKQIRLLAVISAVLVSSMSACKDVNTKLPAGAVDPSLYQTAEAAQQMARGARFEFQLALRTFMITSGRISDEFFYYRGFQEGMGVYTSSVVLDQRYLPDETIQKTIMSERISEINGYRELQKVRARSSLGRRALAAYAPENPVSFQGEMAAYEGFAEIMLADLYCSGIPLSVLQFEGDYVYKPGSSTSAVYTHAVALFDTAIALAGSDASIEMLARIGKGRALLALGRYSEAADAVSSVPDGYVFDLPAMGTAVPTSGQPLGFAWGTYVTFGYVANLKGMNGMNFLTPGDPRIRDVTDSTRPTINGVPTPIRKPSAQTRIVVANYKEARLIQAEALAQAGDAQYLTVLNDLRANGGVAGLAPLTEPTVDPGETVLNARADLVFRERAFWLFFRGQRQGDLRRLLRHYGRTIATTYPQGPHPAGAGVYQQYVDVPIPKSELPNRYFTGCLARGA